MAGEKSTLAHKNSPSLPNSLVLLTLALTVDS